MAVYTLVFLLLCVLERSLVSCSNSVRCLCLRLVCNDAVVYEESACLGCVHCYRIIMIVLSYLLSLFCVNEQSRQVAFCHLDP